MLLVDVHAHMDHDRFKEDLDQVIQRARDAGVKSIVSSGVNTATNRMVLDLSNKYDIIKASFGLYPLDALAKELDSEEAFDFTRDIEQTDVDSELKWIEANKDKCISIGEVGLDYSFKTGKEKEQQKVFQKVIELAERINKPIIIHSRKAELDAVEMLESSKIKKIVMHCFMAKKKIIRRVADNGWNFSIPPVITRLQHFQMMAEMVNINQLLTETDSPYLSPFAGERNEPSFVVETIKKISEIKSITEEDVANNIYMNYSRLFL